MKFHGKGTHRQLLDSNMSFSTKKRISSKPVLKSGLRTERFFSYGKKSLYNRCILTNDSCIFTEYKGIQLSERENKTKGVERCAERFL